MAAEKPPSAHTETRFDTGFTAFDRAGTPKTGLKTRHFLPRISAFQGLAMTFPSGRPEFAPARRP